MTAVTDFLRRLRAPARALGAVAVLALAACGGGDRVSDFEPSRVIVFGDEASMIPANGYRYTVNGFTTTTDNTTTPPTSTTAFDCQVNPVWVQFVAARAGFGFPTPAAADPMGCAYAGDTSALNLAQPDATVAGVTAQIDAFLAGDSFSPTDLVTVYVGLHDVKAMFEAGVTPETCEYDVDHPGSAGAVASLARQRGEQLATQINRIARNGQGGRVLFVNVPSLASAPYGRALSSADQTCLGNLATAFNAGMRTTVIQDGRYVGLVQLDERIGAALNGAFGFENLSDAVCATALPDCTTDTLTPADADYLTYLWADDIHFGAVMHRVFGELAVNRAFSTNPF